MPTEHILMLSYGKDSLACLGAIKELGWPLDRIIHAEVWATDDIPADLPPMVEFKSRADAWIKENFGIEVEHISAMKNGEKLTFEKLFYHKPKRKKDSRAAALMNAAKEGGKFFNGQIQGFPHLRLPWCNSSLKVRPLRMATHNRRMVQETQVWNVSWDSQCSEECGATATSKCGFSKRSLVQGADINIVQYLGIAADEPIRIARHNKEGNLLPLVEMGWDEAYCRQWCEERGLLSPIYTTSSRGGCFFCPMQSTDQLRLLRRNYPDYWQLMLKWDLYSPVTFKSDGHTLWDYDKRFDAEDKGLVPTDRKFRWKMLNDL